jgi:hypothetical protein
MADINIERKSSSIWPWIVGLLLLAVVVFVVLQYFKGRDDGAVVTPADSSAVTAPQYQPAPVPPPATTDSVTGDSTRNDTVPGTTTSSL